jgi:hypothetical protein
VVSTSAWNQYRLASPVDVPAGDMYVGFHDLVADQPSTAIAAYDSSFTGDGWLQGNTTHPGGFDAFFGTFRIRASGGGTLADALALSWGLPCNDATVPGQDYAIYHGSMSDFTSYGSLTCSTNSSTSYLVDPASNDSFWLVVPRTSAADKGTAVSMRSTRPRPHHRSRQSSLTSP